MNGVCRILWLGFLLIGFTFKPVRAEDWGSVSAEELGITQTEFSKVKTSGMPKSKLLRLLEIGVRPNQYFGEPWKKLGVSETYWLSQRKKGMEDDDVNASFHKQQSSDFTPCIAFVLPGYYHYQTQRYFTGGLLSAMAVSGAALLAVDHGKNVSIVVPIGLLATSMIWSAADAFMNTRFSDNKEAKRFTLNFAPTPHSGGEILLAMLF